MKDKGTLSLREDVEDLSHTEMMGAAPVRLSFRIVWGSLPRIAETQALL